MGVAAQLKSGTEALHRQVERTMPVAELLGGTISIESYGALLQRLHTIHAELEQRIEKSLENHPQLSTYYFPKLPWLREDLVALGLPLPCPAADVVAETESAAHLAGRLYVLEGAMLGGQVILKGLKKNSLLRHLPHCFYTGYGPMTSTKWRAFVEMLEREIGPSQVEAAIKGANEVYKAFGANPLAGAID
jgi:heme oxygenase (biliverdin-IX-beta and delta-forming)